MSMTRGEAIKQLKSLYDHCENMRSGDNDLAVWERDCEAIKIAITALHPVSREQVENVWRGEWDSNGPRDIVVYCKQCMMPQDAPSNYCPSCGALMDKEDDHEVS